MLLDTLMSSLFWEHVQLKHDGNALVILVGTILKLLNVTLSVYYLTILTIYNLHIYYFDNVSLLKAWSAGGR